MVTKEQKLTLKLINETCKLLEDITNNKKSIKLGFIRYEYYDGNKWFEASGTLYALINDANYYKVIHNSIENDYFDVIDDNSYIDFNKNVLENINNTINQIDEENCQKKEFHEKINKEIIEINKTLENNNE